MTIEENNRHRINMLVRHVLELKQLTEEQSQQIFEMQGLIARLREKKCLTV